MKFRGSAQVGFVRIGWPFASLSLDEREIRFRVMGQLYVLKKAEVHRLEYQAGFFSQGVRIVHSSPVLDSDPYFRPWLPQRLILAAKRLGYPTISTKRT